MADKKISQLSDGTSFQSGDEAVINRGGTNYRVDPTQFGDSIDVTGTVTSDGLTVDAAVSNLQKTGGNAVLRFTNHVGTQDAVAEIETARSLLSGSNSVMYLNTNDGTSTKRRFGISDGGDISFYDSAGSNQSLYWDSSAERLGINTTGPSAELDVYGEVAIRNGAGTRKATTRVVPSGTTTTCTIDLQSQSSWRPAFLKVFVATVATGSGSPGSAYRVTSLRHVLSAATVGIAINDILTSANCVISQSYGNGTVTITVTVPSGQQVVWDVECTSYVGTPTFAFA